MKSWVGSEFLLKYDRELKDHEQEKKYKNARNMIASMEVGQEQGQLVEGNNTMFTKTVVYRDQSINK